MAAAAGSRYDFHMPGENDPSETVPETIPPAALPSVLRTKPVFLIHNLDVQCGTPIDLIPHHVLRRASAEEIEMIRTGLTNYGAQTLTFEGVCTSHAMGTTYRRSDKPEDWRYWLIEVTDALGGSLNAGIIDIHYAARITEVDFRCYLSFTSIGGFSYSGQTGQEPFGGFAGQFQRPKILDQSALDAFREVYRRLKIAGPQWPKVTRAIQRYFQLTAVSRDVPLYLLGTFAVIEGLLTHDPKKGFDSLVHQVKYKMNLLNSRFPRPLDTSVFQAIGFIKLWEKLYELRSCIAHGSDPDFASKLAVLKNYQIATDFIDTAARAVLRYSLAEPQLILDLQEC